ELAEGFELANYNPAKYQTGENKKKHEKTEVKKVEIISSQKKGSIAGKSAVKKGRDIAAAVNHARDLINAPHNLLDGNGLMKTAKKIGKENKLKVTVLNKKQIEKLKMGAFLGVNKGSDVGANMVILEHKPKGAKGKPVV